MRSPAALTVRVSYRAKKRCSSKVSGNSEILKSEFMIERCTPAAYAANLILHDFNISNFRLEIAEDKA